MKNTDNKRVEFLTLFIILIGLLFGCIYFTASFYEWTLNPGLWDKYTRSVSAWLFILGIIGSLKVSMDVTFYEE